jgi:acetolactate synthase-1/3 small subunit
METNGSPTHTISVYVNNRPGVLVRVAQVFARRAFNIDSLVVSPAINGDFSRMTITACGAKEVLDNIIKSVNRLVDVLHVAEHKHEDVLEKELALVKVQCAANARTEILQIVQHFKAMTVDFTDESLIIQATGNSDKLDAMIGMLKKYGVLEVVRSGKILMARGKEET